MLNQDKMDRLNALAKKKKEGTLTPEEVTEQQELRQEYLKTFRKSFKQRLENLEVKYIEDEE